MEQEHEGNQGRKPIRFEFEASPIDDSDVLLIAVQGELDLNTVQELKGPAELAIAGRRPVILDLSRCPFIDSTGLRLTLHLHNALSDGAGSAALAVVANPRIRKLFSLTAIDRSVAVFATRDGAVDALEAGRGNEFARRETASVAAAAPLRRAQRRKP